MAIPHKAKCPRKNCKIRGATVCMERDSYFAYEGGVFLLDYCPKSEDYKYSDWEYNHAEEVINEQAEIMLKREVFDRHYKYWEKEDILEDFCRRRVIDEKEYYFHLAFILWLWEVL